MGPPVSNEMSSSELGRRNYSNYRSSKYSIKTPTEKMVEEVARLFLDQIHLEKEVEKFKCELAHKSDFTCMNAYQLFNFRGMEPQSQAEFEESLFSFIGNSYFSRD